MSPQGWFERDADVGFGGTGDAVLHGMACLLPAPAQDVDEDSQDDDHAGHHRLPFLRDRHDAQTIGKHTHDEGADDGAQDRAGAADSEVPPITTAAIASSS